MPDATPSPGPSSPPSYSSVLRNRSFLLLWIGRMASLSGDAVFELAVIWYVLISTGSVLLVGLTLALTYVVEVAVGPVAGAFVDRWNRRSVLLATYAGQGVVVGLTGVLYALQDLNYPIALAAVLLIEVGYQLSAPSQGAMLPAAVRKTELMPANGLVASTASANTIVSTALGGVLVGFLGFTLPFEYDALSFGAAMVLVAALPRALGSPTPSAGVGARATLRKEGPSPVPRTIGALRNELAEGLRFLRQDRALWELTVLGTLVSLFAMGLQGLYAPYVLQDLSGGAPLYGFLTVAFSLGAVLGGVLVGHFGRHARAGRLMVLGLSGQSAMIAALGLTRSPVVALGLKGLGGASQETNIVPWTAFQQARIPRQVYGRVSTLVQTIINAPAPVVVLVTTYIATRLSVGTTFFVYGLAMLGTVGLAVVLSRELLRLGPVDEERGTTA